MEVCKTDIGKIIQFLEESAVIVDMEVNRLRDLRKGFLGLENKARLMRIMAKKLNKKLNNPPKQQNNEKED